MSIFTNDIKILPIANASGIRTLSFLERLRLRTRCLYLEDDAMRDANGQRVRLGDEVELWPDLIGTVVCVLDDNHFDPRYPASEWRYLEQGTLIESSGGDLYHYTKGDEDFKIISSPSADFKS